MSKLATAKFVQRQVMIENALADVLRPLGAIENTHDMGRCLDIVVRRCEDGREIERHSLWALAAALEAKLS